MDEDRLILLRDEWARRRAENLGTQVLSSDDLVDVVRASAAPAPHVAFRTAWPVIHARVSSLPPGLLVVAVDERGVAATVALRARASRPVSAIVGRHAACDLYLPSDPSLSLRHLLLLVLPSTDARRPIRFRVLDLRSGRGFEDEHRRPVQAVQADGPLCVHAGCYTLLLFPTPGAPWPAEPDDAWARVPPRAYDRHGQAVAAPDPSRADTTSVQVVAGPTFVRQPQPDEGRLGLLRVASRRGASAFVIGERAARAGVLLGRYDRCDNAGLQVLDDPNVSRVHLLVLEVDGALYAIDAGSTNGVRHQGRAFRERALGAHDLLELGFGLAEVEWLANH